MNAFVVLALLAWVAAALVLGWVMGRRGFDPYTWTLFGVVLGPIAIVLAIVWAVRPPTHEPALLRPGRTTTAGGLDVLVGWDGSPESRAALHAVERLLSDHIGRFTLAQVVAFDAPPDVELAAKASLEEGAEAAGVPTSTVLLYGNPADALAGYAAQVGYDLLALGARGTGRSRALLGSVASALVRGAGVPVLLADDPHTASAAA